MAALEELYIHENLVLSDCAGHLIKVSPLFLPNSNPSFDGAIIS